MVTTPVTVSVIMTAFNAGGALAEAVSSMLGQRFSDWELILVDNGSTDGSVQGLEVVDERVKTIHLPNNIGRTRALMLALARAKGEFCAVLDADDVAMEDRLQIQLDFLGQNPQVVLLGSRVCEFSNSGNESLKQSPSGVISHDQLGERNVFVHSSVMFRRAICLSIGGYDERFQYAQDYDLFQRLASIGECQILPVVLSKLRVHSDSETRRRGNQLVRIYDELVLSQLAPKRLRLSPQGIRLNQRRQALCYLEKAGHEFRNRNLISGVRSLQGVVRCDPKMSWAMYLARGRPLPRGRMPGEGMVS